MQPSRSKAALVLTGLFAFLGFADAAYLTADHFLALPVPCALSGGCETVLRSPYATIGPVPIALLGALYYLAVLVLVLWLYTSEKPALSLAKIIWALSGVGVLTSAFLIYVQAGILHAFCQYCLGSATSSLLLFIASSFLVRQMKKQV